ncbi:MAG: 16S rRNA (cytosine(1402)-N(4))-methyltransferase RsmH [Ruminococcaceae bacterium]|nr:16S rRNA (cytosine(1402)-N(4))-methyltransferase RsmH [Oscillospiraceae bacterium]
MEFNHVTVLLNETVDSINVKEGGLYADLTLGGGGHTSLILQRGGSVVGIDRDITAIQNAKERFQGKDFTAVHNNFSNIKEIAENLNIEKFDGIIADLGVSSPQLDDASRGFSYMQDAPLDMRMDRSDTLTAKEVVNEYSPQELFRVISCYGEERWASRIVNFIIEQRNKASIETTFQLVDIIKAAIPLSARKDGPHPAKRTFQAIRIEVNGELKILEQAVHDGVQLLKKGGRMSVITFHSLEDRIIKKAFADLEKGCTCPKEFPVCVCGNKPSVKSITRKPLLPSEAELNENPRARSSKLRTVEKII